MEGATPQPTATDSQLAALQQALKRCSPETLDAACRFRRTRSHEDLDPVVVGMIERYVERDLRPKLQNADDSLRLMEDLGLDSLSLMEIVVLTEDVLNISVSNEELTNLRTLGDVRRFVAAKAGVTA